MISSCKGILLLFEIESDIDLGTFLFKIYDSSNRYFPFIYLFN